MRLLLPEIMGTHTIVFWPFRVLRAVQLIDRARITCNTMRQSLTPLLCDVARYTSYGRHFTNTGILMEIVTRVIPHLAQGDLVVDCSCGANEWLEIMRNTCEMEELNVSLETWLIRQCSAYWYPNAFLFLFSSPENSEELIPRVFR